MAGTGVVQHELASVAAGATYALSAAILDDDPRVSRVRLRIDWQDSSGSPAGEISNRHVDLTSSDPDWQSLSIPALQAPADAARAQVAVYVITDAAGGAVYIDGVSLAGPPAPPATPTSAATPTAPSSVTAVPAATGTAAPTRTPAPSATATVIPTATPVAMPTGSLLNGGFEEANDGVLLGWQKYGGTLQQTAAHRRSGNFAAAYISDSESTKWVYQALHVQGDQTYAFDGYVLLNDPNVSEVFLRVSWYASDDASGQAIAFSDSPERLSGGDPSFRYLTTGAMLVPAGTRSAKARIMLVPVSAARATVYLDDMSLRQAPLDTVTAPLAPPTTVSEVEPLQHSPAAAVRTSGQRPAPTAAAGQSPLSVKINEVMCDPAQVGDDAAYEWLELYNGGTEPVDAGGWTLADNQATDSLPPLSLPPQGFAVVAASERFREVYPSYDGSLAVLADGEIGNGLANDGDHLVLRDATGRPVDAVSYGDDATAFSPPAPAVAAGHSLERSPAGVDTDTAADFVDNARPSPGKAIALATVAAAVATPIHARQPVKAATPSTDDGASRIPPLVWAAIGAGIVVAAAGTSAGTVYRRRVRRKTQP